MIVRLRTALAALVVLAPLTLPAQAEGLALTGPGVLDQAQVLTEVQRRDLQARIEALDRDTGIEMAVVTQPVRDVKTSPEGYATQLFNNWGIGEEERNDGILVLLLPQERVVRIELGKGYHPEADLTAQDIISRTFLPAAGRDLGAALTDTTLATIDRIALPHAGGVTPAPASRGWDLDWLVPSMFFGALASLIGWNVIRRRLAHPRRGCPSCGATQLEAVTLNEPDATGQILTRHMARCASCGWFGPDPAPPAPPPRGYWGNDRGLRGGGFGRHSSGGGGRGFGGGSSSGGGASGRW